jgi:hypothetical protein
MSAEIVQFAAARIARVLRLNAAPGAAADFIAHMTDTARDQRDAFREAFWREVGDLVRRRISRRA